MDIVKDCGEIFNILLSKLSEALGYEFAIFDRDGSLVAYTDTYIVKKGTTVHKPFLTDVLRYSDIIVKKPGEMEACRGCRFRNHCPASIEILSRINFKECPAAVLSLTSFRVEDRKRVLQNIDYYLALVKEISAAASGIMAAHSLTYERGDKSFDGGNLDFFNRLMDLSFGLADHKSRIKEIEGNPPSYKDAAFESVIGESPEVLGIINKLKKFVDGSASILLTGETGTGKELFARCVHNSSMRFHKPFIAVNCGSIPEALFESELFGYDEGAFTGAKKGGKPGKFQLASGGTIFLDEIGELPMYAQPKLLRVLQDNCIDRIGGTKSIPVGVRVVAASNRNFEQLLRESKFRMDLYYRLAVVVIEIPPLRERRCDIPLLAEYYLNKYSGTLRKKIVGFTEEAMDILKNHEWRGNVRELENAVEYATHVEQSRRIKSDSLPDAILNGSLVRASRLRDETENVEYAAIRASLDKYGWSLEGKKIAADELGISLRTLYRKLQKTRTTV